MQVSIPTYKQANEQQGIRSRTASIAFLRCGIVFLLCAVMFPSLLFAATFIPSDHICSNVQSSIELLQAEGDRPTHVIHSDAGRYDNFTTALMLDISFGMQQHTFDSILSARYHLGATPGVESLVELFDGSSTVDYPRYWHGYVVILKPLLLFFSLSQIRLLMLLVSLALLVAVCISLIRTRDVPAAVVLAFCGALFCLFTAAQSLSLAFCFIIAFSVSLYVLHRERPDSHSAGSLASFVPMFFLTGALTSYFDFLTVPLVTLGIPLCLLLYRRAKRGPADSFRVVFILVFSISIAWLAGYALLWAWKWILVALLTNIDIVASVSGAAGEWSGGVAAGAVSYGRLDAVLLNLSVLGPPLILFGVMALLWMLFAVSAIRLRNWPVVALLAVSLFPFLWYIVLCNHSGMHYWFTYRDLIIACLALLLCPLGMFFPEPPSARATINEDEFTKIDIGQSKGRVHEDL